MASRLNCSFNEPACRAVLLLLTSERVIPTLCSQLISSRVTVMIIRNHLGVHWFGVGPHQTNRSASVPAMFVVVRVIAMKHESVESLWWSRQNIDCTCFHNICTHAVHLHAPCAPLTFSVFLWMSLPLSYTHTHSQCLCTVLIRCQPHFSPQWAKTLILVLAFIYLQIPA